ncbi:MAG: tRNA pseudouridine(55) synthase TruB [Patescibacteria group bacterium]
MTNIFAVYKPVGPTSNDILEDIRRRTGIKKVGHAGTLDPLASGVLVVAIGRNATKRLSAEVAKEKEYLAAIRLGEESTTDDAEGEKTKQAIETPPSREQIQEILPQFVGQIEQMPPKYSAVKIKGREAYKYARQNQAVILEPRMVTVKEITLVSYAWPDVVLRVVTGPGVYIRSLARDLGRALGVGGYIFALERTRVGEFTKDQCVNPDQITVR